jgi:hypothetical protein
MLIENNTCFQHFALPGIGPSDGPVVTVVVKGTFDIPHEGPAVVSAQQEPIFFGDQLQDPNKGGSTRFEDDLAIFKPRCDVVIVGKALAPKGSGVQVLDVGFHFGKIQKIVRVFGDRHWQSGGLMGDVLASAPAPFAEMDLVYENAFGGMDLTSGDYCAENPVGRGVISGRKKDAWEYKALPNLEDPNNLIKSWKDRPRPVGFGFIGKGWAQRVRYLGAYDEKWKKERYPGRPLDFTFDFFNAAPLDQQVEGYLKGDESGELFHLTPEGKRSFELPGKKPVVSVSRSFEGSDFEDVSMNLDTLCLMPAEERFYLLWRGLVAVEKIDEPDVARIKISV